MIVEPLSALLFFFRNLNLCHLFFVLLSMSPVLVITKGSAKMKNEKIHRTIVIYLDKGKLVRANPLLIFLYIPGLYKLYFSNPVVVINDEGITYNPPKLGSFAFRSFISWEEISALYPGELTINKRGKMRVRRFLCILPKDVDRFLQPFSLMSKTALSLLTMQVGTPFVISELLIQGSAENLLSQIRTEYADFLRSHNIELRQKYSGSVTSSNRNTRG
jgi:hypothetical protein